VISILVVSALAAVSIFNGCRDVVFNNPLDPNASRANLTIQRVFATLLSGPGDICFDGEKIWKAGAEGRTSAFDMESGTAIRSFHLIPATGIAFLERRLYLCGEENQVLVYDPLSGSLITRISTSEVYPRLLAARETDLLLFDSRSESVFSLNPETRELQRLFQLSGLATGGMEFVEGSVLISDSASDTLYRLTYDGAVIDVYRSPLGGTAGICKDDRGYIYLMGLDGQVAKVTLP